MSDLTPESTAVDGFRVNMSDQEAKSADREPLPGGKFHYKITDMDIMAVKDTNANGDPNKNAGKPYINFEFTVQDGPYAGRNDWTNAMCFEGALYTISQICKALGMNVVPDKPFVIPRDRKFYIGKDIWGRRGTARNDKNEDGSPRIQLRGFSEYKGGTSEVAKGAKATTKQTASSGSVLP